MKRISVFPAFVLASFVAAGATPPTAPVRPVTDDYFGTKVTDNYRWMENLKDPKMKRWMKAQADYTRATLDALPGYAKLLKRIDELNQSQSAQVTGVRVVGERYYTLRTPQGAQSPKLYVRDGVKGTDSTPVPTTSASRHGFPPSTPRACRRRPRAETRVVTRGLRRRSHRFRCHA